MQLRKDNVGTRIVLDNGAEVAVMAYDAILIDGLEGELADGETFTLHDGCTVTRQGDEAVWVARPTRD